MKPAEVAPSLEETYLHLLDGGRAAAIELTPTFWQELASGQRPEIDEGRLVMSFSFADDWPTWERHPEGDEIGVLLLGQADLVLEDAAGERTLPLRSPGQFAIIPRGTWHTARTTEPCRMIFITPGKGTEHREA